METPKHRSFITHRADTKFCQHEEHLQTLHLNRCPWAGAAGKVHRPELVIFALILRIPVYSAPASGTVSLQRQLSGQVSDLVATQSADRSL